LLQELIDEQINAPSDGDNDSREHSAESDPPGNYSAICQESGKSTVTPEDMRTGPFTLNELSYTMVNHNADYEKALEDLQHKMDTTKDIGSSEKSSEGTSLWYESTINEVLESMEAPNSRMDQKLKQHFASLFRMAKTDKKPVTQSVIDDIYIKNLRSWL
jgi:hypothetical protein